MPIRNCADAALKLLLTACLAACAGIPARAQSQAGAGSQNPKDNQGQQTIRVQTALVNVFATVRDKNHAIAANLGKDDFKIYEDGVEQKLAFFSKQVDLPITLAFMLDTSGSEADYLGAEQSAASRFIREVMRKGDLVTLLTFDQSVDMLADFTEDKDLLDRAIQRARINAPVSMGAVPGKVTGTAFYDGIYLAAHDQLSGQAGRKAMVIVTDADDQGSKVNIQGAIEAAQRSDAVVHIILVIDPRYGGNSGAARKITDETGGRVVEVRSEKNLEKAFDQISEELRSQYTLGYYSSNSARDGSFRKIKVETKDSSDKVLARRGYYAPRN
jgi:VWFA-related protein